MLMSLDTSTTSQSARVWLSARTTPRMWLSAFPTGKLGGRTSAIASVCRNRRPVASVLPIEDSKIPSSILWWQVATSASSERLACRALRATSDRPFLWPSNSSSVIIGRKMSCSSKRNRLVGSCINTLVSSTNSLGRPLAGRTLRPAARVRVSTSARWAAGRSRARGSDAGWPVRARNSDAGSPAFARGASEGRPGEARSPEAGLPGEALSPEPGLPGEALGPEAGLPGEALGPEAGLPGEALSPEAGLPGEALSPEAGLPGEALGPEAGLPGEALSPEAGLPGEALSPEAGLPGE